jgi:TetR/AcrR family transcriptional repressor of nem operon
MRYHAEHKERTRQRILAEAAGAIRSKGPDRVGVAEVMAKLDLTHGGFYAHFASKDDLIAQAITYMFDERFAGFLRKTEGLEPKQALQAFIDEYLTTAHRDTPNHGCPLAALGSDLPRLPEAARARFTDGAQRLVTAIAKLLRKLGTENSEALASSALTEMVGALALSRAINDPTQSESILRTSRQMVKTRLGVGEDE